MIYLDCSAGASGDMVVAALVDLGADAERIRKVLRRVAVVGFRKVRRRGVRALKFDVEFAPKSREYVDLVNVVKSLRLSRKCEKISLEILKQLARAESKAHKVPLKKVHLHEAVDCVVDAVSTSLALEELGALDSGVIATPVSVGYIAPATMHIIRSSGMPVRHTSGREITTPTGAAILSVIASRYECTIPEGRSGVGAGSMMLEYPNVLRAVESRDKFILETNVDDCTPEHVSFMIESLMGAGAIDVHVIPCLMKKGRLGYLIRVLSDLPEEHSSIIMEETGTLGVRRQPVLGRFEARRMMGSVSVNVDGCLEEVGVKYSGVGCKPEYDDVRRLALKHGMSFRMAKGLVKCGK
ncbi:MAG: LarC family nickel insertion protein [Candidatus Altiarchaeota archaeon]